MTDNYLEHHGIKGMKWGVRRSRGNSSSQSADYKESQQYRERIQKNGLSNLSNSELSRYNNRLNLEQNYKRMNPTVVARGYNILKTTVAVVGTVSTLVAIGNSPVGKSLSKGISKIKK